jgi:tetratricopeptide (TPR) repeat protein
VLISSQGGVNFYIGNNTQADGLTMVMPDVKLDLSLPWNEFVTTTNRIAESTSGHKMTASEISSYWNGKAIDFIVSHPLDFLNLTTKRLIYFFSGYENSDQADIYQYKSYSPILNLLIFDHVLKFPFGLISPLALLGIMFPFKQRRYLIVIYIFMIAYIPTVILFLVTARHRLAVVAILMIFAAFSISKFAMFLNRKAYRQFAIYFGGFLILAVATNLKPFGLGYDSSAQFNYQKGQVLDKQGKFPEAIAAYRESVRISAIAEAYNNLGFDLSRTGDRIGAYDAYHRAIHLRPNYSDALNNLSQLFLNANQFDSAQAYLTLALSADSARPQVWLNLGDLHRKQGDRNKAQASYLHGININPSFAPLYNNLANLYLSAGMADSAEVYLSKVLEIDSTYAIANANYANLLLSRNDFDRAKEYFARALTESPGLNDARFNLGLLYYRTHQPDSAKIEWEITLQHDPNNAEAKRGLKLLGH